MIAAQDRTRKWSALRHPREGPFQSRSNTFRGDAPVPLKTSIYFTFTRALSPTGKYSYQAHLR